jgi:hypothetical protein
MASVRRLCGRTVILLLLVLIGSAALTMMSLQLSVLSAW